MESNLTEIAFHIVTQISIIILLAKVGGEIFERFFRQPSVLGELLVGILISPFFLGKSLRLPGVSPLFPIEHSNILGISSELYVIAQIAVVILLFIAGVETDISLFFRYFGISFLIGLGGVILPFILGDIFTILFGYADSFISPKALFMGAILTATSVGITARILSDMEKINTPEGVSILAAAVIDDVLGILVLTIVVGIVESGEVSVKAASITALKAFSIWLIILAIGLIIVKPLTKLLKKLKSEGAWLSIVLSFAFFSSYLAEYFGLAMIIGSYAMGLAFSTTELKEEIIKDLKGVYHFLVPIFFVVMGMLVNLSSIFKSLLFGITITFIAILSKIIGCSIPAFIVKFNILGATRIGVGMIPRGEVALIVAGVALARGVISHDLYGVAIMVTFITTLLAPVLLVPLLRIKREGIR
ncbi:MAG: cation:proton antiporter [Candidatus Hydrothermales bacterium]